MKRPVNLNIKNMLRKALLFIPLLFVLSPELLATGPSYIKAGIKPISINDKGEILCYTRFLKNPSGGHYVMDIEYGLCVLTNDTILQFPIDTVSFEETADSEEWSRRYEVYEKQLAQWDLIFQSQFKPLKVSDMNYHPVAGEYGFKEANVSRYARNDTIFVDELSTIKKVDLQDIPQKALYGAEGICSEPICRISISYDFGNIVVIENSIIDAYHGEDFNIGAVFNYPNLWEDRDIGYDCQDITGILFIKNNNVR